MINLTPETLDDIFIGLSETEAFLYAESQGWRARTLMRDGNGLLRTNDVRDDRLNFYVAYDSVIRVFVG